MLEVHLNRVNGHAAIPMLRPENVRDEAGRSALDFWAAPDLECWLDFPAAEGAALAAWLELARDALVHLAGMDNAVQRSCAAGCAASGLHSRNYESVLASVTLAGPHEVVLHYYGAAVNTEWDERFIRGPAGWASARGA